MLGLFFVCALMTGTGFELATVTFRTPRLNGASRRNASLYRSMIRPPPQAHQSTSVTMTHREAVHTRTCEPRQFPCRKAAPAAAYIPPGYPLRHADTPCRQYQVANPLVLRFRLDSFTRKFIMPFLLMDE